MTFPIDVDEMVDFRPHALFVEFDARRRIRAEAAILQAATRELEVA